MGFFGSGDGVRNLDTKTLKMAARDYSTAFNLPSIYSKVSPKVARGGRDWVMQSMWNFDYKDEFDYVLDRIKGEFGSIPLKEFEVLAKEKFQPRSDKTFAKILANKLAITPDGEHIAGKIGTTDLGGRFIKRHLVEHETIGSILNRRELRALGLDPGPRRIEMVETNLVWPIYTGEIAERLANSGVADELPPGTPPLEVGAFVTRVANANVLAGLDALIDLLDGGSAGATIQGRTGSQPAGPDTAVTGTNLFTATAATTAFGAAADDDPGAFKTAAAITDDSSADNTGTLGYCRASSSNAADTPLVDMIDGEAGTSGADWIFNTLAIVSGAVVSITSWITRQAEG